MRRLCGLMLVVPLFAACDGASSALPDLAMSLDLAGSDLSASADLAGADFAGGDLSANLDLGESPDEAVADLTPENSDLLPRATAEPLQSFTAGAYNFTDSSFNTNYRSKKQQFIYLASDLTAAGIPAGATITALSFMPSQTPARTLDGFRLALANTGVTPNAGAVFPIDFYVASPTVVYGPVDEPTSRFVADSFTTFTLTKPFQWDGTSNLLVELSFELAASASGLGGIYMRDTGRDNELIQFYGGAVAYPFTGIQAINGVSQVPRIQIQYD